MPCEVSDHAGHGAGRECDGQVSQLDADAVVAEIAVPIVPPRMRPMAAATRGCLQVPGVLPRVPGAAAGAPGT